MVPFESSVVIDDYIRNLEQDPVTCEKREGRSVYISRPDFGALRKSVRFVQISDFGLAVLSKGSSPHHHLIQPLQARAPEVILGAGWTYSADIWNLGMAVSLSNLHHAFSQRY
jgi:serine/threonine-protein kinase SRPK3